MRILNKFFCLSERGTTVRTEVMAGITTFMTMIYILAVNPGILGAAGMDPAAVFAATAISAAIGTCIMALAANLPIALAPGMGLNVFFAFTVVISMGHTWQFALTAVFIEGLIFIALTLSNLREAILNCIPESMKKGIAAGIGLFITFVGLQSAGIVVRQESTLVTLGSLTEPGAVVALLGMALTSLLLCFKVRGALFFAILGTTILGIPLGVTSLAAFDTERLFALPNLAPTFWQFEWHNVFTPDMLVVLLTFLFVDLFNTVGTLIGVTTKGNLLENGKIPRAKSAFLADAVGTTVGAVLGTSTVASFVESASGVAEGGRTGLTALTTAALFVGALFLAPVFLLIPSQATAAALVAVGLFMLSPVAEVDYANYHESIPMFFTMIMMPLTYSVANGILFGLLSHVFLYVGTGRGREVSLVSYALAVLLLCKVIWG